MFHEVVFDFPGNLFILTSCLVIMYLVIKSLRKIRQRGSILIGNAQGIGDRREQEDSFATAENEIGVLAVLADGMGGLSYGKKASNLLTRIFSEEFSKSPNMSSVSDFLVQNTHKINKKILEISKGKKVGSTFVAGIIKDSFLYWISVGDSQIYLYRNQKIIPINPRHIYKNILESDYRAGKISKRRLLNHSKKERLTSYLGYDNFRQFDYNQIPIKLKKRDKLLFCSDGVYKSLYDTELEHLLGKRMHPMETAELILEEVLEKNIKKQDNATVIVLEIK
ncbi:hypothetical protein U472_13190 [Orenia metallireducens]|jgi:serine/threonine protein phosphatase PrpC|uniref:PPM-type phosphatase domain-containing protein n=1 Tax=Orenia metallireducens TaxID=1413210 RepID=A0A1C0A5C2_9FIRM|nr:protein phosphatase 2C domain-containing protein [Orenia metallireducens]OCL25306.1 hypothetical protein U472_13190 [Orenia metallireducens]